VTRWRALFLISAAELAWMSLWFGASAAAPALAERWGLAATDAGQLTLAVQLGFVGTLVSAVSNLSDVYPPRHVFAASALLAALGILIGALTLGGRPPRTSSTRSEAPRGGRVVPGDRRRRRGVRRRRIRRGPMGPHSGGLRRDGRLGSVLRRRRVFFGGSAAALLAVAAIWGATVVADSAQFSACVTELADPRYVGTALTLQICLGFLLTTASIALVGRLQHAFGWQWAFAALAPGPALGVAAMLRLRSLPEATRIAQGRR
jgi:MFS family permease